ncbi:hypothetical protein LINPERPRIM_LOCUS11415 [Linum perenne]
MDCPPEELQFPLIPQQSPKTFLITSTLIFPLSFTILAYSLFTTQSSQLQNTPDPDNDQAINVASIYTAKLVSFSSTDGGGERAPEVKNPISA